MLDDYGSLWPLLWNKSLWWDDGTVSRTGHELWSGSTVMFLTSDARRIVRVRKTKFISGLPLNVPRQNRGLRLWMGGLTGPTNIKIVNINIAYDWEWGVNNLLWEAFPVLLCPTEQPSKLSAAYCGATKMETANTKPWASTTKLAYDDLKGSNAWDCEVCKNGWRQ